MADEDIRARCFHPFGKFVEFPPQDVETSIPQRFEKMARNYSGRLAIRTKTHSLTYDELNAAANRVAHTILNLSNEQSGSVVLLLDHGALAIATILGVLKAGKFYVPVDPSFPSERIRLILEDSQAFLILTDNANRSIAEHVSGPAVPVINIDGIDPNVGIDDPGLSLPSDSIACILYTSGSTGEPKGVIQNHRNLMHQAMVIANSVHLCPEDRTTLFASLSAAQAADDMFVTLLNGATLAPLNIKKEGLVPLKTWLEKEEITIFRSSASVFRYFVDTLTATDSFPNVRVLRLGSESVLPTDVDLYKAHFPAECVFLNTLSSTETGTIGMHFLDKSTTIDGNSLPVGYAVPDMDIVLLEDDGKALGFYEIGQIAVMSDYLSPGYWRRPELTQTSYLEELDGRKGRSYLTGDLGRMLPDGCLIHHGRKDSRDKIRGYNVEVAAVEAVLLQHENVKQAAVVTVNGAMGEKRLSAYLTVHRLPAPLTSELQGFLSRTLPVFMIPAVFTVLDEIPLTPSGKLDRAALPRVSSDRPMLKTRFVAPRSPLEEKLVRIWSEVLSVDRVGVHDIFLEIGGDSLQASRIISRIGDIFPVNASVEPLLNSSTIAEMATIIAKNDATISDQAAVQKLLGDVESLSDEEARRLLENAGVSHATTKGSWQFWENIAPDYTTAFSDIPEKAKYIERTESRHVFSIVKTSLNLDVLDLGCGFGRWAVEFGKRCRRVVAVDFSVNMIARARERAKEFGLSNVEFEVLPIQQFHSSEKFDIIVLSGVLVSIEDGQLSDTLKNARCHLKPGGCIVVREIVGIAERHTVSNVIPEHPENVHWSTYRLSDDYVAAFREIEMRLSYARDMAPLDFIGILYDKLVPNSKRQSPLLRKLLSLGLSAQLAVDPVLRRNAWLYRSTRDRLFKRKTVLLIFK